MAGTHSILERLRNWQPIEVPVALVAAHPDDETVGAGASLYLFRNILLVYLTDGAPRDLRDTRRAGFATTRDYTSARFHELEAALTVSGTTPQLTRFDVSDQQASLHISNLIDRLRSLLAVFQPSCVITHPYEGGHPDHDAAAFIVHHACPRDAIVEFTSYHADNAGGLISGTFLDDRQSTIIALTAAEQDRKRAMFACFETQQTTLAAFGLGQEVFRLAPAYDFTLPPHSGRLYYEQFDWGMTGVRWRELAAHVADE